LQHPSASIKHTGEDNTIVNLTNKSNSPNSIVPAATFLSPHRSNYNPRNVSVFPILNGSLYMESREVLPSSKGRVINRSRLFSYLEWTLTYYASWWCLGTFIARITFRSQPSLTFGLAFPRILPPDAKILTKIRSGDCEGIKDLLLNREASVSDMLGPYGLCPLCIALIYGKMEVYQLLLSAGACDVAPINQNFRGSDLWRFWEAFASCDYETTTADIIKDYKYTCGSEYQAKALRSSQKEMLFESHSFTRLHKCILGITLESLQVVLSHPGVKIDERDLLGRTALHLTVFLDDAAATSQLLDHGADPNIKEFCGKTPLHIAAELGSLSCTDALISWGANLEITDRFGNTPLHNVCLQGHRRVVEFLLDAGAQIDATNPVGEAPLRNAVFGDHLDVVKLLHQRGAAFAPQDSWGSTPVHNAVRFNSHRVLRFLLELKLRVDQKYYNGRTVLHLAAESGDLETLKILGEFDLSRVDVTSRERNGRTAMDYLMLRKDVDVLLPAFQRLLARMEQEQCYPNTTNHRAVLWTAEDLGNEEIEESFEDAVETQLEL